MSLLNDSTFPEHFPPTLKALQSNCWNNANIIANCSLENERVHVLGNTLELVAWCLMYSALSFIIIIGNALTIAVFRTNARFSRKKEHGFLLSLAIADILVAIAGIPLQMFLLVQSWTAGQLSRYITLNFVFLTTDVFFGFASIFTLTAIALERVYSVLKPQKHRKVKRRTYWYLVRLPWVASALQSCLYLLSLTNVLPFDVVFQFIAISLLCSMLVMCVAYMSIWISMTKRKQTQGTQTSHLALRMKSEFHPNKERKLTISVGIVTGAFVVTWLPFQILNLIFYICHVNDCKADVSTSLVRFVKLLQYSNSLINPLIYSCNIKGFRACLRKKIATACHLSCLDAHSCNIKGFRACLRKKIATACHLSCLDAHSSRMNQKLDPKEIFQSPEMHLERLKDRGPMR